MLWRNPAYYAALFVLLSTLLLGNLVHAKNVIWIDTDPACGNAKTDDVDDCWALMFASRSDELTIRGISTVFGNSSGSNSYRTAIDLVHRFDNQWSKQMVYRGADRAINPDLPEETAATQALAMALTVEPLTIVALGPLTNIASLIRQRPDLLSNIEQIVAVAGQRSEQRLGFYPGNSRLIHLHDLNFRKDVAAFKLVLNSPVQLTLVPYEVASRISIQAADLAFLNTGGAESRWLGKISKPWLDFWETTLGADGFFPFDSLVIGVLTQPALFTCESTQVKVQHKPAFFVASRDKLLVSQDFSDSRSVNYCFDVQPGFKVALLNVLAG